MDKDKILPLLYLSFSKSTEDWTDEEVGCYIRLLIKQWDAGHISEDLDRLIKISDSVKKNWQQVKAKFIGIGGNLMQNKKLEDVRLEWKHNYSIAKIRGKKESATVRNQEENEILIKQRKDAFAETLRPFIGTYTREMVLDFYHYWTEENKQKTKFRSEMEKTWDVGRRLKTWASNENKYGTKGNNNTRGAASRANDKKSAVNELANQTRKYIENRKLQYPDSSTES